MSGVAYYAHHHGSGHLNRARLLRGFGVQTVLVDAEGPGLLKCTLDEVRDPAGAMAVVKAVAFRVEMRPPQEVQQGAGYQVEVAMIQERGALSSFKLISNRLRREWELDNVRTRVPTIPEESPAVVQGQTGKFLEMMDFNNM